MAAQVVEIAATDLRYIKESLTKLPEVISAAQLGTHLRVLVKKEVNQPIALLQKQPCLQSKNKLAIVRPSLEDVFVSCTGNEAIPT